MYRCDQSLITTLHEGVHLTLVYDFNILSRLVLKIQS